MGNLKHYSNKILFLVNNVDNLMVPQLLNPIAPHQQRQTTVQLLQPQSLHQVLHLDHPQPQPQVVVEVD